MADSPTRPETQTIHIRRISDGLNRYFILFGKDNIAWIDCVDICFHSSTSGFRYYFYFRFAPDSVVSSRTMSMLVEVHRACPETLPQPLRSPWYHFLSQSYNYFRYTSAILEFLGEGNVGQSRHIHQWKLYPPKHRYSHWHRVDICFRY